MVFIGEWIIWQQWVGVVVVLFLVDMVIKVCKCSIIYVFVISGYLYGVGVVLCQVVGVVVSCDILSVGEIDVVSVVFLCFVGGMVFVVLFIVIIKMCYMFVINYESDSGKCVWFVFVLVMLFGIIVVIYL